jgi:hypothetical protein
MLHRCPGCNGQIQCQATPPSESSVFYTRVWGRVTFMFLSLLVFFITLSVISKQYGLVRMDRILTNPSVRYDESKSSAGDVADTEKLTKEPAHGSSVDIELQRLKENASDDRRLLQSINHYLGLLKKEREEMMEAAKAKTPCQPLK